MAAVPIAPAARGAGGGGGGGAAALAPTGATSAAGGAWRRQAETHHGRETAMSRTGAAACLESCASACAASCCPAKRVAGSEVTPHSSLCRARECARNLIFLGNYLQEFLQIGRHSRLLFEI